MLTVDRLSGRWQEAELTGSAQLPAALLRDVLPRPYLDSLPKTFGPAHASLQVTSLTPAVLAPFLSADTLERLGGRVDLTASMEADEPTLEAVRGDITLDRAEFTLARVPVQQTQPTRLRLAAGRVTVEQWAWAGGGNQLALKGGVTLNGPVPTLDLGLNGSINLRMLGAFVPEAAIGGRATVDVTVGGTTTEPLLDGRVVVEDTDIVVRDPRLAITSLAGTARLTRDRVVFEDVTASANGGQLRLAGGLDYHDFALTGGTLTVTGHGLALEAADGLRTEVDANLSLAAARDGPSLEGQVTILRGAYRKPVSLAEQLLSTATTAIPAAAPGNVEPSFLDRLSLGVAVVSAEDVQIDNNYGRFDVASNLRVSGTASDPVLQGRLTIREGGEVFLGGQTYRVQRGTIDFTSTTRLEPVFNLALDTRVQRYDITLSIGGTPEALEVTLSSPRPQPAGRPVVAAHRRARRKHHPCPEHGRTRSVADAAVGRVARLRGTGRRAQFGSGRPRPRWRGLDLRPARDRLVARRTSHADQGTESRCQSGLLTEPSREWRAPAAGRARGRRRRGRRGSRPARA